MNYIYREDNQKWFVGDVVKHAFFVNKQRILAIDHGSERVTVVDDETGEGRYETSMVHLQGLYAEEVTPATEPFQLGRCYRHTSGKMMHIVGSAKTTMYGWCLVAEEKGNLDLKPVGQNIENAANWSEISFDDWLVWFDQ